MVSTSRVLLGCGLFFALLATLLKIIGFAVPHFVDVHLVEDVDDQNDDNRIAGIGIFQSEFDATDPALAAAAFDAGVPPIVVNSPTLEFPLLFPSQENFFPELLPLNERNLPGLEAGIPGSEGAVSAVEAGIAAVEALEFDNCGGFVQDLQQASIFYFNQIQEQLIPSALFNIHKNTKEDLEAGLFEAIDSFYPGNSTLAAILSGFLPAAAQVATAEEAAINFGCNDGFPELDPEAVLDANGIICVSNVFIAVGSVGSTLSSAMFVVAGRAIADATVNCVGIPLQICIFLNANSFFPADNTVPFDATVEFASNINLCDGTDVVFCPVDTTTREYFSIVGVLLTEIAPAVDVELNVLAGLFAALAGFSDLVISGASGVDRRFDALEVVQDDFIIEPFLNRTQPFTVPCDTLEGLAEVLERFGLTGPLAISCDTLEEYFEALPVFIANSPDVDPSLVVIVNSLNDDLYATCFGLQILGNITTNAECPVIFGVGFVEAILGEDEVAGCEDDVEDNEKIATAQGLAISSMFFEIIAVILICVAFCVPTSSLKFVARAAAFLAFFAAILIISGLLVVQSAPVYGDVGGETAGEGFEPIFYSGFVGALALVNAVFLILSSVFLLVALCFTSSADDQQQEAGQAAPGGDQIKERNETIEDKL